MTVKIVVLAGGLSTERAVSLVTGCSVCRALREKGHRAILVDLFLGLEEPPAELETLFDAPDGLCPDAAIEARAPDLEAVRRSRRDRSPSRIGPHVLELCRLADMVFIGLHGQDGEDGRVQAMLDLLGVPYTGSGYLGSGMAMDKAVAKGVMEAAGVPTPAWRLLDYAAEKTERLAEELPMPCVIKATTGGSSLGVYLPEDRQALRRALTEVRRFGGRVMWEERISGRELTVAVLGGRALPPIEILPAERDFDYAAKYQAGGAQELCPAPVPEEQAKLVQELAVRVHRALDLEVYSRADFILDWEGRAWCLEVNSLPGMTPGSLIPKAARAVGIDYPALCQEIVQRSHHLKRRG